MKKIILFLILLIPCLTFGQSMYLKKLDVKDSIFSTGGTGIINMSEYYKDGVPFSSGGGDVYLGNRQTFSARNEFNDTIIANGYGEFDNIKLTNYINFLGDVISDLGFLKGATIRIGTLDNYGMQFRTADTNRIVIDSLGRVDIFKHTNFYQGIQAVGDITTFGNLTAAYLWGDGSNLTDLNASNISTGTISDSRLPGLITPDTISSPAGNIVIKTTSEDTLKISGIQKIKSNPLIFENTDGAKKATLSTNSSGDLVISTNRAVAITGDLEVSGFSQFGSTASYVKTVTVKGKTPGTVSTGLNFAHNITDYKNIISWSCMVRDSAGGNTYVPGAFYGAGVLYYARVDSLNCRIETGGSATSILNDSVFFHITYRGSY